MPLPYADLTGANFLTTAALDAARSRAAIVEPHQTFDRQRLWADLLSSQALAFNLFADAGRADDIVRRWFADAPGPVESVRFAHSPGRLDPAYLNSLRAFAAAFTLDAGGGRRGVVAVEVLYHERNKAEIPRPENHARYAEVAVRSGAFSGEAVDALLRRSDLCVLWLEHLLLHSMLQHPSGTWTWGRLVVVHPAANVDAADLCARYRSMLGDATTFAAVTLEELVESGALGPATTAVRRRYVVD
jgi:hypothetical protein